MHRTSARPAPLDFLLPSAHSAFGIDRRKDTGLPRTLPQLNPVYFEAPVRDGLRTPPTEDMAATYPHSQYNTYAGQRDSTYSSAASSNYSATYSGTNSQGRSYPTQNQQVPVSTSSLRREVQVSQPAHHRSPSPESSRTNTLAVPVGETRRKGANNDMILPNLQIPSSINDSGGSLAEFAAQITCFFWFESPETLLKAERLSPSSSPIKRLREEALPSSGFRKWVVTILSTTQVTQNVILLALLFIYRLKKINPGVDGRSGSEYRLLTVALMLGNKFLDDNTYTNKTWAEVSGISVTEIHVMEVEFLSNMRYSLLASKEQWKEWQEKLSKFSTYCDRAAQAPLTHTSPLAQINLPSPPSSMQASPPSTTQAYSASSASFVNGPQWSTNNYMAPLSSPLSLANNEQRLYGRKRSFDGDAEEPVAKRVTRPSTTVSGPFHSVAPTMRPELPRLPVPNLTISTSQPMSSSFNTPTSIPPNVPLLPPLSGRAMSTVYPSTPTWAPQLPLLTPTGSHGNNGYSTPTRRHSPHSVHELLSIGSSPISGSFPTHSPGHISPSFFLQQRSSPYKPVRHVNTLLYPPPSASMHDFSANANQMHYQPLGKRNDYRPGVVPDYTSHASYQPWPVLPQPNFHS